MSATSDPLHSSTTSAPDWQEVPLKGAPIALVIITAIYSLVTGNWQALTLVGLGVIVHRLAALPIVHRNLSSNTLQMLDWPPDRNPREAGEWVRQLLPAIAAFIVVATLGILAQEVRFARSLLSMGCYGLLALGIAGALSAIGTGPEMRSRQFYRTGCALALGCIAWLACPPAYASRHPIFQTPVKRVSVNRPAVHVILKDDRELGGFDTAELYLAVQSSRFPSGVQVLLPIKRGDFRGCMQRFIQLPFEVEVGDNLSFELIDDNQLTPDQEQQILMACKAGGYCVRLGNAILSPELDWIVAPTANAGSEMIASATVLSFQGNPFRNFGSATFIVESSKPTTPNAANPINLLDRLNYSRAAVKVYYPVRPLSASDSSD